MTLASGALPLALGGMLTAYLLAMTLSGTWRRVAGALTVSLLTAPQLVGILHGWLGALDGDPLLEIGAVSLALAATALAVLGLHAVWGIRGLGLGAITVVLLGNPLSAASSAPELLPTGWGDLGQLMPPGALVSLLRSLSGFDGAGASGPILVLLAWLVAGLALVALGRRRAPAAQPSESGYEADAGVPVPAG